MSWEEILRTARILVVDDEPANVRMMERVLERAGYARVVGTTDSSRVAELYGTFQPDLVLLDLHMPEQDGFTVMGTLKPLLPETGYLPILVVTADTDPAVRLRALLLGAKDFLTKPYDHLEALLRIRIHLTTRFQFLEVERELAALRRARGTEAVVNASGV